MTIEEARQDLRDTVDRWGWAVMGVESKKPWTYTVGFVERFDHPELVLAGPPYEVAHRLLNALGSNIAVGERLSVGDRVIVGETELVVGPVHPVHVAAGLIGRWQDLYRHTDRAVYQRLAVLQVLPEPVGRMPRLDRPFTTLKI